MFLPTYCAIQFFDSSLGVNPNDDRALALSTYELYLVRFSAFCATAKQLRPAQRAMYYPRHSPSFLLQRIFLQAPSAT